MQVPGDSSFWPWLLLPMMAAAAVALAASIAGLVRTVKRAILFRVPLLERQTVELQEAGRLILYQERPARSMRLKGLEHSLVRWTGALVEGRPVGYRSRVAGLRRVRVAVWEFAVPQAGRYVLETRGPDLPRAAQAGYALIFARPHLARTAAFIVATVLSFDILIAGLVLFLVFSGVER